MTIRRVRIHPAPLGGRLRMPGDKSISHRALLFSALAGGGDVSGVAPSGDIQSMAGALRALGVEVDLAPDVTGMLAGTVRGRPHASGATLDCGNSGTAMRLLAGVCAGLDGTSTLVGDSSLHSRPMERVANPLRLMGAAVETADGGTPPIVVTGGHLSTVIYNSPFASAQVKSCVLLAALTAGVPATVVSPLPSRDHTERMLAAMGADIARSVESDGREVVELQRSVMRASGTIHVPGDPSSAAFWLVAAVLGQVTAGASTITIDDVSINPTRVGVVEVLRSMGADLDVSGHEQGVGDPTGTIIARPARLSGGVIVRGRQVVDAIDELPILALAGAMSDNGLEVRDAQELRAKESDRIAATARSLGALGIDIKERPDGYLVPGGQRPGPGVVHAGGDHRIAMTAAIAATVGTGPVEIDGFASVATSYPSFLADLEMLGGSHEVLDAD